MKKILLAFMALLILSTPLSAQKDPLFIQDENDRKAPLKVTSNRMVSSKKNNLISFFGSVIAIKGKLKVEADVIHVKTGKESGEYEEMEAIGSVKITSNGKVATGDKANYYPDERKIVITGDTTLTSDNDKAFGDKVIYYLDSEDMEIFGKAGNPSVAIFYSDGEGPNGKGKTEPKAEPKPKPRKKTEPKPEKLKILDSSKKSKKPLAPQKVEQRKIKLKQAAAPTENKKDKADKEELKPVEGGTDVVAVDELSSGKDAAQPVEDIEKKAAVTATRKKTFTAQVGSYSQKDEALKLSWSLKGKGYDIYINTVERNGVTWYRVRVGEYKTRAVAERMVKKLKERENLPAFLTSYQN